MTGDEEEGVRLSLKEFGRWQAIKDFVAGRRTARSAAEAAQVSIRHVRRLAKRARVAGVRCVVHGNRGRVSNRRLPPEETRRICSLYRERYHGFNLTHFREMLRRKEKLRPPCRETIRRVLAKAGLWERRHKSPKHRQRRPRREREGDLLQIDASLHHWFGEDGPFVALVAAVDDATGKVVAARFVESESTNAYMTLFRTILGKCGVPLSIYSDRHSVFFASSRKDREALLDRGLPLGTQFGRAMRELGIRTIPAYSPQAKGRVERLWGTFQDRLLNEMRLEGITSVEDANRFLSSEFLPRYNREFAVEPACRQSSWRPSPGPMRLASVFCLKETRVLSNDNTFTYEGTHWQVRRTPGVPSLAQRKIEVRCTLQGQVQAWLADRRLKLAVAPRALRLIKPDSRTPLAEIARAEASYTRRARLRL